ncbi:MAG TPA: glutathione S-transferase [Polyangiales bacterium]|nr:glutathione S-transferase [Polyangiales bacterium]
MLTVFGRRNSANVQKVMWLIGELRLPHRHVPKGGSFGGLDTLEYRAMNPAGKVPAIDDQGVIVWESHAILRYLAARHGAELFWPEQPAKRARSEPWMDWSQSSFQPDFLNGVFWGLYRTPEPQRDWPAIRAALTRCEAHTKMMDDMLAQRPFLAGETLSLADISVGTLMFRYFTLDIERPARPHVEAWYRRLEDRPAYRESVMVPYDDLFGRLAF